MSLNLLQFALQQTSNLFSIFIDLALFILIILMIFLVILIIPFQLMRGMIKSIMKTFGEIFE